MTKEELAEEIYNIAHLTGEFKLRSGQVSNEYFDKYQFESEPMLLRHIANQMKTLIPFESKILAGLEMGGIPIATALSFSTGSPVVFVRKKAKDYGTCKLAEGPDIKDKTLCVIEDVVTTGGQIIESVKELRERGATIDTVICVIVRDDRAFTNLEQHGLKLKALFTMQEIKDIVN